MTVPNIPPCRLQIGYSRLQIRIDSENSPLLKDVQWLQEQKDAGAFIPVDDYRKKVLGDAYGGMTFDEYFDLNAGEGSGLEQEQTS